jgi:AcrR family transcriptional regulator
VPVAKATAATRRSRPERESLILDTAQRLFYARGVHEVGMDELVGATGLGKASVYRLYPTKDALVAAYLQRLAGVLLAEMDATRDRHGSPRKALLKIFDAVERDLRRPEFRGCAFNNASIEFDDPTHPARVAAREYREQLAARLGDLAVQLAGRRDGRALGDQLAVLVDGAYTNAAHLGPDGPAAAGLALARQLVRSQARSHR